jgi:hypothetical protein
MIIKVIDSFNNEVMHLRFNQFFSKLKKNDKTFQKNRRKFFCIINNNNNNNKPFKNPTNGSHCLKQNEMVLVTRIFTRNMEDGAIDCMLSMLL